MTEITEEEVERIARGLTKAQRNDVIYLAAFEARHGRDPVRAWPTDEALENVGIVKRVWLFWIVVTPLGRRVAASLSRSSRGE